MSHNIVTIESVEGWTVKYKGAEKSSGETGQKGSASLQSAILALGDTRRSSDLEVKRQSLRKRALELLAGTGSYAYLKVEDGTIVDIGVPIIGSVYFLSEHKTHDRRRADDHESRYYTFMVGKAPIVLRAGFEPRALSERLFGSLDFRRTAQGRRSVFVYVPDLNTGECKHHDTTLEPTVILERCASANSIRDANALVAGLDSASLADVDRAAVELVGSQFDPARDPDNASAVPYDYLLTYCWMRAHKVCQFLEKHKISSLKLWCFAESGGEAVRITPRGNKGKTDTQWNYHVATLVKTRGAQGTELRVVDPAGSHLSVGLREYLKGLGRKCRVLVTDPTAYELAGTSFPTPLGACETLVNTHLRECQAARLIQYVDTGV